MSPTSKTEQRRIAVRKEAQELLACLAENEADPYMIYRRLYALWCSNNAAVTELRPLFRMEGVEPDGHLNVSPEFRTRVLTIAKQILPRFSNS